MDIIEEYIKENKGILIERLCNAILNGDSSFLTKAVKIFIDGLGESIVQHVISIIEDLIINDSKRKDNYIIKDKALRKILTEFGRIEIERRIETDLEAKKINESISKKEDKLKMNVCLTDKVLGLDKGERIDKNVKANIIEKASEMAYRVAGKNAAPEIDITPTTVMKCVRANEWKTDVVELPKEEKIHSKYIYIQVDEDHVKMKNAKTNKSTKDNNEKSTSCKISKLVTIYSGKLTLTKPEKQNKVKQIRKELVNKHVIAGLYLDNDELWEDVSYYLESTYEMSKVEKVFIMGDGASYIKAGLKWIKNSVFVLDEFHLKKYMNVLNYDKTIKSCLEEAIECFSKDTVESIMDEAIEKVELEIKEEKEREKNTSTLEHRVKKLKETRTYLLNQWDGIEAYDKYKGKLTGCCQEGQVHHTLSSRLSTDAKVWSEDGANKMSELRAFIQNKGNVYEKIIDIKKYREKKKKEEKLITRIRKKASKKCMETLGIEVPHASIRDELYYSLKNIWNKKVC